MRRQNPGLGRTQKSMITLHTALLTALTLNLLWFGAGFHYFSLKPSSAAKVLVPKASRESPLFVTIAASVRFLGGMNFALAFFSLLLLANLDLFPDAKQIALFCAVFAVAHGSQFYFNLPVALGGGRKGESLWPVLFGPMRIIFVVDATLMVANAVLVVCFLRQ